MTLSYDDFLKSKMKIKENVGIDPETVDIPDVFFPHQVDSFKFALKRGRALLALSFGLGKTNIQAALCKTAYEKTGKKTLVICPLGVRQEFTHEHIDGRVYPIDIGVNYQYVKSDTEIYNADTPYLLTNYERVRDGNIDPRKHDISLVSLDEGAVIRSLASKTYDIFEDVLKDIPLRYICTATPSPNEFRELIYYANILDVKSNSESLAQPLDANVLTQSGWVKMGDIKIGDNVISKDGNPAKVVGIHPQGVKDIYKITFSDGYSTECTEEHLWLTKTLSERQSSKNSITDYSTKSNLRTTQQIVDTLKTGTGSSNHTIPNVKPVNFEQKEIMVDPYLMGLALGDGCLRKTSIAITTNDDWIANQLSKIASNYNLKAKLVTSKDKCNTYYLSNGLGYGFGTGNHSNQILNGFREYGLLEKRSWQKFVPQEYLFNDVETRLSVLQGLMDSDGNIDTYGRARFVTTSKELAENVVFLTQSLGGIAKILELKPDGNPGKINGKYVITKRLRYRVVVNLPEQFNPFRLPRKASRVRKLHYRALTRYITNIEKVGQKEAQCIAVDCDSHLYVTDNFIVTHNTRWFGRDVNKAGNLQLLPQYEEEFWLWVSTWALFLYRPSDLGHNDQGYELPQLKVRWHRIPVDYKMSWEETDNRGQYRMLPNSSNSASEMAHNKRRTVQARLNKAAEIINDYDEVPGHDGIILWHHYESERQLIQKHIPEATTVYGSQKLELREKRIVDFENGGFRILATKPQISGSGCNFQHWAHRNVVMSLNFKFADFIQALHRTHRFMQSHTVEVDIIYSEAEDSIASALKRKWKKHEELTQKMQSIVKKYGLATQEIVGELEKTIGVHRQEERGQLYTAVNNDNVSELKKRADNSVDLIVTSIPFDNHYEYTTCAEDFSFNANDFKKPGTSGFWEQMDYLTPELYRTLKPGRVAEIHVKDRTLYSYQVDHGLTSVYPFSDETVMHFLKHGFVYEGRRTIVTDVVRENNTTYRLGYTEMSKDATKMGSGLPEYLLTFRKPNSDPTKQYADERVTKFKYDNDKDIYVCGNCKHSVSQIEELEFVEGDKLYKKMQCPQCGKKQIFYSRGQWQLDASSFWQSNGNSLVQLAYDFDQHWRKMHKLDLKGNLSASFLQIPPESKNDMVWDDVVFMQCLNANQSRKNVVNHICPLPFDIVKRAVILYSDIGDTVLDPFAGLFTVPYIAIQLGRIGYGIELNTDYYTSGKQYCEDAEVKRLAPSLFDLLKEVKN